MANIVWLPRLKKLALYYIQFEALPRLLWDCPVLEYLLYLLVVVNRDLVSSGTGACRSEVLWNFDTFVSHGSGAEMVGLLHSAGGELTS